MDPQIINQMESREEVQNLRPFLKAGVGRAKRTIVLF